MKGIKKYRHAFLIVLAGAMAIGTFFMIVQMIVFLSTDLSKALNTEPATPSTAQFDTQGFDQLHLVQPSQ